MDEPLKKRLVGAAVLASLAVIFLPMLFDHREAPPQSLPGIPEQPPAGNFASRMLEEDLPALQPLPRPAPVAVESGEPDQDIAPAADATADPPAAEPKAWIVQVGSFSTESRAAALVEKLRKSGFQTQEPEPIEIRGKQLYRVRVGPMISKDKAQSMLARIDKVAGTKSRVLRYP